MKLTKIALACLVATGVTAPQFASADDAFEFHGYSRMGIAYEEDGNKQLDVAWNDIKIGAGRLGNEPNSGEWLFLKKFAPENGTNWDVGMMLDWGSSQSGYEEHGEGNLGLKQLWAGASNVFESQPNAYVWAGKVFHSRMQQGLADNFVSINDGDGAGIKGLDLGFANFEFGAVTDGGSLYALTSQLSAIKFSDDIGLDIIANFGFSDNTSELDDSYLLLAKLTANNLISGWNQAFTVRQSDNQNDSFHWSRKDDLSSLFLSAEGSYAFTGSTAVEYVFAMQDIDDPDDAADRVATSVIVRPTHAWNDIHSTWLEFGYSLVDFDSAQEDDSVTKVTLSQNIAVGSAFWARPMVRFYVTTGQEEIGGNTESPVIVGGMFEAWW